ncbi:TPA: fimbrial protein [Citrobacter freundii]
MKIKSLFLAMALIGFGSQNAFAAEGRLNFIGEVVNSSCELANGSNGIITVAMGKIPVTKLAADGQGPEVGVHIDVTGCEKGTYYLVLDGTSVTESIIPNLLALTDAGTEGIAKNVGIRLTDLTDKDIVLDQPLDKTADPRIDFGEDEQDQTKRFELKARYVTWGNPVPGTADATARFTIVQY